MGKGERNYGCTVRPDGKEQLLNCLPEEVRVWIRERKAKDSEEVWELEEAFLQARDTPEGKSRGKSTQERWPAPPSNCPRCGLAGHWASHCRSHGKREKVTLTQTPLIPVTGVNRNEIHVYTVSHAKRRTLLSSALRALDSIERRASLGHMPEPVMSVAADAIFCQDVYKVKRSQGQLKSLYYPNHVR